jgi:hypothetical protein
MINTKETLKKLHKKFPLMTLDELFEILDCFVEESIIKWDSGTITTQPWTGDRVWYNNDSITVSTLKPANKITTVAGDITAGKQIDF